MIETKKLLGKPIADDLKERDLRRAEALAALGMTPMLRIIRVGERPDDLAYERRIISAAAQVGVRVSVGTLQTDADTEAVIREIETANHDGAVHGILLFRPLPDGFDEKAAVSAICVDKDVDGVSEISMARLYEAKSLPKKGAAGRSPQFFIPCTAEAVMRILSGYGIEISGKRAVVIGRSTVIGKPAAMLLTARNATVTIAHSRTENLPTLCREADILVCAAGMTSEDDQGGIRGGVGTEYLTDKQTVIDVGIHVDANGRLFGDVDRAASEYPAALTPVPGGVGSVTTQILLSHVISAAERSAGALPRGDAESSEANG